MFCSGLCATKRIVNYGKQQDSLITCRVPSCRPYVEKCTIIFLQRCVVPRQQITSVEVGSSCTEPSYGTYRSLWASKDFDRIQLKRFDVIGLHIMHCRGGYLRNTVTFQGPPYNETYSAYSSVVGARGVPYGAAVQAPYHRSFDLLVLYPFLVASRAPLRNSACCPWKQSALTLQSVLSHVTQKLCVTVIHVPTMHCSLVSGERQNSECSFRPEDDHM